MTSRVVHSAPEGGAEQLFEPLRDARPLFVLGAPRSGTTFLARLLDSHPAVLVTDEVRLLTFFQHAYAELAKGGDGGMHCSRSFGDDFATALDDHLVGVVRNTYARIAQRRGDAGLRYWGDKNPHHSECLDLIERHFPDAFYVRIRRDPRDVVCSILEMQSSTFGSAASSRFRVLRFLDPLVRRRRFRIGRGEDALSRVAVASRSVARSVARARDHFASLPAERTCVVDYEELVRAPEQPLQRLFVEFLGLPCAAAPRQWLAQHRDRDSHARIEGRVDFEQRSIGRWRRELSAAEVGAAERELGDVLRSEGYA